MNAVAQAPPNCAKQGRGSRSFGEGVVEGVRMLAGVDDYGELAG